VELAPTSRASHTRKDEAAATGEWLLQRLAALASTLPEGEAVARSLELDGFQSPFSIPARKKRNTTPPAESRQALKVYL
jgi:hypothetical protein